MGGKLSGWGRGVLRAGIAIAVASCGGSGTEPEPIGPPARLTVSAGNQQIGSAGQPLLAPIAAKVSDANGRGVPNIPVDFQVVVGAGSIESTSERTNGAGIATARWRVGTAAGSEERVVATVIDTLTGALIDTAVFVATVAAGSPVTLFGAPGSGGYAAVGQTTPIPLRAVVVDAYGNRAPGATVTWQIVSGEGTLASATTTSNADGEAVNSFAVSQSEGDVEIQASLSGTAARATFTVLARFISERVAYLAGSGFGIARTPDGELIVTLIHSGGVQRISMTNPGNSVLASVGGLPVVVAVDATGRYAYAANMGTGMLSIIDIGSMASAAQVDVPGEAHSLALSPRGDRVYVTNTANSVFEVDIATRTIVRTVAVGSGPWGIAFWTTATDSLMYVTARDGGSVSEVDMRTGSVLRTLVVSGRPHGIAISPDGSTLYVADDAGGRILFVDRISGNVNNQLPAAGAFGIAIAPDGRTLFTTTNSGYIVVVDVPSATITKQVSTMGQPRQIMVLPDGNTALAANMNGWVDKVTR